MSKSYSWLQISDLHIFESTDWNIMLNAYRDLSKVIKPDFLVVTGDFCHQKKHPSYDNALNFLNQVVIMFHPISKQFLDLTLCNSANGGKACIYGLFRHLLYGRTIRI